ncbi:MAG: YdcF family protein [Elioraea sp.]|nr:YdcF family protein [Elioraea sp.]MDW8444170.1 YdcF family protein [Acetobacteraceae bacterium]
MDTFLHIISKTFWFIFRPGTFALLIALIGLVAIWRGRRWGRWPIAAGLGIYLVVLATPLPPLVVLPLEERFARPAAAPSRVDGVIVLGGAVEQNLTEARGIPALNGAAERMTELVVLARRYPEARLVFTGGQGSLVHGALSEADVARALFLALGVPGDRLLFESDSRNTWENAVFTRRLVGPKAGETWLLITSASHMPRSVGAFRKAGWEIVPWPVNYRTGRSLAALYDDPFPQRLQLLETGLREWIGLLAYRVLGRSDALFPAP